LAEAQRKRSELDERVAILERQLERQMVAEGLIEDPAPKVESAEAALYFRDFFRLSQKSVRLGFGGARVDIQLSWSDVLGWADRYNLDTEEALELMFRLRDERELLENQYLSERK
jgi:hypothetical protein